ncbi:hypothetical protein L1987_09699 [Smallanthus sonchifolius]|uniref:Uncharacterized protein n=1 Tax=Smallanthus sonchifolius TaxID=185202 RepID=A0ACB9JQ43_9ASTR|nr:hypothetical protein L1987_09699 [Smallanthus sonchifolius]
MDGACVYDEKTAIHELTQGLQMAKQLTVHPHSPEARDLLIQKILSSYHNAHFILQSLDTPHPAPAPPAPSLPESSESPGSKEFEFDQPFSIQNVSSRKRKGSATWEDHVRICSGNGLEDNTDDGFSWRKYGQKDISGAKFPRNYYRCSYSKEQKCLATKQVQRADDDPAVFDIAYKGKHTCKLGAQSASPPLPPPSPKKNEITPPYHHQLSPPNPDEMLSNLRANLSVDTSDLGGDIENLPSSFSFPSTSSGLMEDLHQFHFPNHYDDELWQVCSPFISPATSKSNFFTEWGSSSSLDFLAGPADANPNSEFMNSFF